MWGLTFPSAWLAIGPFAAAAEPYCSSGAPTPRLELVLEVSPSHTLGLLY